MHNLSVSHNASQRTKKCRISEREHGKCKKCNADVEGRNERLRSKLNNSKQAIFRQLNILQTRNVVVEFAWIPAHTNIPNHHILGKNEADPLTRDTNAVACPFN